MKKFKLIFCFIILVSLTMSMDKVYADRGGERLRSDSHILLPSGQVMPHWYEHTDQEDGVYKRWYLYDTALKEVLEFQISETKIYGQTGQLSYFTTPTDNPKNLAPLKDPNNFDDTFDNTSNRNNSIGYSYISRWGKRYPTVYPNIPIIPNYLVGLDNYNFKDGSHDVYTYIPDPQPDPDKMFFTHPSGIQGNVRQTMTWDGISTSFIHMTVDHISDEVNGYQTRKTLIKEPWKKYPYRVSEGFFNKEFRENGEVVTEEYTQWYQIFAYYNKGLEESIKYQCSLNGLQPTLENQVKMFFKYFSIDYPPTIDAYGHARELHTSGGSVWSASVQAPKILPVRNLRVASEEFPLGDYKGIEVYRNGVKLNPETDILKVGDKLEIKYYVGLETSMEEEVTFNKSIKTNIGYLLNDNTDYSYADYFKPLVSSKNYPNTPLKPVSNGYLVIGDNIRLDYPENVATYEEGIVVPEHTGAGEGVNKITIYGVLPYQNDFYTSDNIDETDNQKRDDDISTITFEVEAKNLNDLEVSSIELRNLNGSKVDEVIKGQDYKLVFTYKNIGQEETNIPINFGIYTNTLKGQYFNIKRDGIIGNTVNSVLNRTLLKGQEAEFIEDIHIPVNTLDKTFELTAFIPKNYDTSKDNIYIEADDIKKLELPIKGITEIPENLAIKDIRLINTYSREIYDKKNPDGSYWFELNKSYEIEVIVEKTHGVTAIDYPKLELEIRDSQDAIQQFNLTGDKRLQKVGDTTTFRLRGYRINNSSNIIDVFAKIPDAYTAQGLDDNPADNTMFKQWRSSIDIMVTQFELNPRRIKIGSEEELPTINIGFNATVSINTTEDIDYLDDILAVVQDNSNRIVYQERDIVFTNNKTIINYTGEIENYRVKDGNNPFRLIANYDKNVYEWNGTSNPYSNNVATANLLVEKDREYPEEIPCSDYNLQNNWSVTFRMFKKTGTLESKTVSTKDGGTKTIYYCVDVETESWEETRSYYEKFQIEAVMFRSPSTIDKYGGDGWINIKGNSNGIVRAGQWYEFYIVTYYNTNRTSVPSTYRRNKCNYQTRSPNAPSIANVDRISLAISGYGKKEVYMLNQYSTSGSWYNQRKYFRAPLKTDAMGETVTRRYIPTTGENGIINLRIVTEKFDGYTHDEDYNGLPLQDCRNEKIYVKNPLNVRSQKIGGN
ncbi:hypothetical protein [Brassicibacter mesophilus]|uniref:hypothetical protein n=1 Tax=Brassicibacter mesophilus TaxID=745119 RepID=UPI003D1F6417